MVQRMDTAPSPHPAQIAADLLPALAAGAEAADRDAIFPAANMDALHRAGLLALTVPRRYGGQGGGLADAAAVIHAVAQAEPATALVLAMQYTQHALIAHAGTWPAATHALVGETAVRDGALINALRVEPELGTPARGGLPDTLAARVPEGWRLRGHKIYATGIPVLRWLMVWCRTEDGRTGNILVPPQAAGVRVVRTWDTLGMRATESHDVLLEDVVVPTEYAVDLREQWPPPEPLAALWNAVTIGALYQGVAVAARDWLAGWLHERRPSNLGASLATLPRLQAELGGIDLLLSTGRLLWESAAAAPPPPATQSALLKVRLAEDAIEAVTRCIAMAGNPGLSRRHRLERHFRDVQSARIHTPQRDTAVLAAGRATLGV
jgi:alkylation response protein AidB-like acyl-CoA dehydrogenase